VEDSSASKLRYLMSIHSLERREAAYIKRLEEVRGVGWHAESNDLVLYIELIKFWRSVATIAVKDKKSIRS
jgi:hypothetical protein